MKRFNYLACFLITCMPMHKAGATDTLRLQSPSGKISLQVWMAKQLMYSVKYEDRMIIAPSAIDMLLSNGRALSINNPVRSSSVKKISSDIISPVPEKRKTIRDVYNELSIRFKQPFGVEFRAYDDGIAYRISTAFKDSIIVRDEVAEFNFPENPAMYFPEIPYQDNTDMFMTSFEHTYSHKRISEFPTQSITYTPVLITPESDPKIAITESDLESYPGMFLTGTAKGMKAVFAHYPLEEKIAWDLYSQARVSKRADYIAQTKGTRTYPWRVMIIAAEDRDLPSSDIVYRLGSPSRLKDVSWIHPGTITDEWIIDLNLFNIPFKSGRNTDSYKYYIDFANRFGYDRIMMDAGWSDNNDLLKVVPEINMDTLLAYAKQKNVKIALWTLALTLNRQLDSALDQFKKWGIDFIMTDFIDRDDQKAVDFHYKVAKACSDRNIMIMFHGSYPPKGFNRTFPNAVAREAVLGSEYNIWSTKVSPAHDVLLAYTRMLAGYLDYEPGLLINANQKSFRNIEGYVMSPGTRAHQASMLVIYDNPMQFFSGNPSQGWTEPRYMELIANIPTIWDETKVLEGKVGEFIVTARRDKEDWYVGGMTDWTARDLNISFDFLDDGEYNAVLCKDGVNADRYASDYILENLTVNRNSQQKIHLAEGGGFLMTIKKK